MKLRNKKTGEIGRLYFDHQLIDPKTGTYAIVIQHRDKLGYEAFANYFTLTKLNEEWEDYMPKEPLIKDEKIRKTIKEWFNANNFGCRSLQYYKDGYSRSHFVHAKGNTMKIFFREEIGNLKDGGFYDIDDLCGEEEE